MAPQRIRIKKAGALDKVLADKFCRLVRRGLSYQLTCDMLSVSYSAFHNWQKKGNLYIEGNYEPKAHKIYGYFVQELRKAGASLILEHTDDMRHGEGNSWGKHLTILERRDRQTWGPKPPDDIDTDEGYDPDERFL